MPNLDIKVSNHCECILYGLVLTLVFEGILRKVMPAFGIPLFFLKDALCIIGLLIITGLRMPDVIGKLRSIWLVLLFLFIPLLIFTSFKDPILAAFAIKQYLLYVITGIMVAVAFPGYKEKNFRIFIFLTALLLIPTTIVAAVQNALPATHWLNVSVDGESLEGFSAAGYLRVSSTFSFTAQYSWFLNAISFFLATSYFMPPDFKLGLYKRLEPIIYLMLLVMLIVSAFITGGRTAVLGCLGTITLGGVFIVIKRPSWFFSKGVLIIILCIVALFALRVMKPQFFMAYDQRSAGNEYTSHNEQISYRILGGFTDWTNWFWEQEAESVILGNGLGIMSNGASQLSAYASRIRANGFWTEGDIPTTFWEGGLYFGVIWYGFRILMILFCYQIWNSVQNKTLGSAACIPLSYIVIHGLIAQFGIQPPLSIWWWFAIGILIFIYRLEKYPSVAPPLAIKPQKIWIKK